MVSLFVFLSIVPSQTSAPAGFLEISGTAFSFNGQRVMLRGVNFSNERWVYGGSIADIDVDEADYERLEEWGANSVRFIVSAQHYLPDREGFYRVMDRHVAFARAHGLWMIPNLHVLADGCFEDYAKTCPLWQDSAQQDAVVSFWRDFAKHYESERVIAGYDLLNEPKPPATEQWFKLAERLLAAIRSVDRNHFSVVESGEDGQFPRTLGNGVAYSVHVYDPETFTSGSCGGCSYPGLIDREVWDRSRMIHSVADGGHSIQWARDRNVPLWIGEFGSRPSRGYGQYLSDMVDVMNKEWNVHWSLWSYRSDPRDFGMYTCPRFGCPDPNIIDAIVPGLRGVVRPSIGAATPLPAPSPTATAPQAKSSPTVAPNTGATAQFSSLALLAVAAGIFASAFALLAYVAHRRRIRKRGCPP